MKKYIAFVASCSLSVMLVQAQRQSIITTRDYPQGYF